MSKQIQFFMLNEDEAEFFQKIQEIGDVVYDDHGNRISIEDILNRSKAWIATTQSNIILNKNGYVDSDRSDIIEYSRTWIASDKKVFPGRIWLQTNYYSSYDESARVIKKADWIVKKYETYKRWIVKNYKIDTNRFYYIGKHTYLLYKQGVYKMMLSPKFEDVFE